MKIRQWVAGTVLIVFGILNVPMLQAQTAAPAQRPAAEPKVALKLLVTLTEYDGATKISNLPYTIPVVIEHPHSYASVRIGVRVPIKTEDTKAGQDSVTYSDVGTNIDVEASTTEDGRYSVMITVDRSSLYVPYRDKEGGVQSKDWAEGDLPPNNLRPMLRQFRAKVDYLLRDGQSSEIASTTDPLSGHVLKIEAVATALK